MNRVFILVAVVMLVLIAIALYSWTREEPISPGPIEPAEETTVSPGPEPTVQYEQELPPTGGPPLG